MTRDKLLLQMSVARKVFDDKVASLPPDALHECVDGFDHSVVQLVAHVSAYDHAIVERLASAGHGAMTSLAADRDSDRFAEESWTRWDSWRPHKALERAQTDFETMKRHVGGLDESELLGQAGVAGAFDPRWLRGRLPWQAILRDTAAHYTEHFEMLDAARERHGVGTASS